MSTETSNRGLLLEQGRLLLASAEEDPDALKKWLASIEVAGLVTVSWGVFFFELAWLSWVGWVLAITHPCFGVMFFTCFLKVIFAAFS